MAVAIICRDNVARFRRGRGWVVPVAPTERYLIGTSFGGRLSALEPDQFPYVMALDIRDDDLVKDVVRWCVVSKGVQRIVALHEKCLMVAAELRDELHLAGDDVATTLRFRDKVVMKDALRVAGFDAVPRYRAIAAGDVPAEPPWPGGRWVVKGRLGVGSTEVRIVDGWLAVNDAVAELARIMPELEVEEFVCGHMYHCDSVVVEGQIEFAAVARYFAQPGEYAPGGVAGSLLLPDCALRARILRLNHDVLDILEMRSGVTHLEVFHTPDDLLVFCEVAARPGGGGIDRIVERAYAVDLVECAVRIQCGVAPLLPNSNPRPAGHFGVLGVYHPLVGDARPLDDATLRGRGVLEYVHSRRVVPGAVVHCTDYAHRVIVEGESYSDLERRMRKIAAAVTGGTG